MLRDLIYEISRICQKLHRQKQLCFWDFHGLLSDSLLDVIFCWERRKLYFLCFCAWSERNGLSVKLLKMRYNYIVLMRYKEKKKINDEDEERAEYKSKAFSAPADLHPQPHLRSQALKEWDLGYKRWSFLRGGAGLSLREGVQSSVIQEELKVELLHSKKSRLRWFWHLPRMPSFRRGVLDMSHWEESPVRTWWRAYNPWMAWERRCELEEMAGKLEVWASR